MTPGLPIINFTHSKSACLFVLYFGDLEVISIGKKMFLCKKMTKNNNNRFETHFYRAPSWYEPLSGLSCRWHMTSLGPSCSLLTQPLTERYSLIQLDFFQDSPFCKSTKHIKHRLPHSININSTNKILCLHSLRTDQLEVLKDIGLGGEAFLCCHSSRKYLPSQLHLQ